MVTKSGTNQFHGSAFEYNRIKNLAAQNFFATSSPKSPYIRNEFGGTLGGPIKKDKLFFFGSYEGLTFQISKHQRNRHANRGAAAGEFLPACGTIYDPSTCVPGPCHSFNGNQIPNGRISSASQFFNKYFDTPNLASTRARRFGDELRRQSGASKQDEFRYEGRGDYTINNKNQLSAMWFDARYVPRIDLDRAPNLVASTNPATYQNVAINCTSTLKPTPDEPGHLWIPSRLGPNCYANAGKVDMHTLFPQMPEPPAGVGWTSRHYH